jgi:3-dehydroquinate synthetase
MQALNPTQCVNIDLAERSYPILIASKLLGDPASYASLPAASTALIVTNLTVAPLYAQQLHAALTDRFKTIHVITLPDGEEFKTWQTLNLIFDSLLANGCDRKTVLFALGGGVVGAICASADDVAVASGLFGGGENRYQPPAGQEHDWCVLPAAAGGV